MDFEKVPAAYHAAVAALVRAIERAKDLQSPYAVGSGSSSFFVASSPVALCALLAGFVFFALLSRAATTLYGPFRALRPLRTAHHAFCALFAAALGVGALAATVAFGLPPPVFGSPAPPSAAPVLQAAPPSAALLFGAFALRVAELAGAFLAPQPPSVAAVAARCTDAAFAWLVAFYAPGGPALWLLVADAAASAASHAAVFCRRLRRRIVARAVVFCAAVFALLHAGVAGWARAEESPVCPRPILRVAAFRALVVAAVVAWRSYGEEKEQQNKEKEI